MSEKISSIYCIPGLKYFGPLPNIGDAKMTAIIETVCNHLDVDVEKVRKKDRNRSLVMARQISMFFTKELTKLTLNEIGQELGGRDHTTVIYGIEQVRNLLSYDSEFQKTIQLIRNKLT